MRILLPIVATIALAGLCGSACAQAQCPELTRLRSEATESSKPKMRGLMIGRCEDHIRASQAWSAVLDYAREHQDVCDVSSQSLSALEASRRAAVTVRDNVCAGRPARPFPADIIQQ
ncbi:hypothetical protein [Bradyrhizobium commune]|uniref:Uncharacterized protein n=1 Tax=Bradyrhizobium commune TaxID=83627 RepID=A0A7S9GXG4_9BRAD|nr:hypothetical protein [Bradyrhizobium commune]QPF88726.1 hypothetical protein IC761_19535 [Bradyrhizobium commune]